MSPTAIALSIDGSGHRSAPSGPSHQPLDLDAEVGTPETDVVGNPGDLQERRPAGRFRKGRGGNPAGRRPGSRNKATLVLDALGDDQARAVLGVVARRAKEGDMRAAEILLNRVWPVPEGRLTPSEAGTMLGLPETHMQAVETARVTRESHASAKLLDL